MKTSVALNKGLKTHYSVRLWSVKSWQTGLKSRRWLVGRLNRLAFLVVGRTSATHAGAIHRFAAECARLCNDQGLKGLQLYLKACAGSLVNSAAGRKVHSHTFGVAVSVTRKGLPRIIPAEHRRYIRSGNIAIYRLWLTLFMLYRVIDIRAKVNIDPIVSPYRGSRKMKVSLDKWMPVFMDLLIRRSRVCRATLAPGPGDSPPYIGAVFRPLLTSGPNSVMGSVATSNVERDALSIMADTKISAAFRKYCREVGSYELNAVVRTASRVDPRTLVWNSITGDPDYGPLGRLNLKYEPGKVRVFAMIDFWTQTLLRGIHEYLFSVLGSLNKGDVRLDGSYGQDETFLYLKDMVSSKPGFYWSLDLSSATDRFPISVQESVIRGLLGSDVASAWQELLVGRSYDLPRVRPGRGAGAFKHLLHDNFGKSCIWVPGKGPMFRLEEPSQRDVRYAVGQPMGAHSSWPAFTLAHHAIVQYAAWLCGWRRWFEHYGILGDDIVIRDNDVALMYQRVIKALGVDISLNKSLLRVRNSFEFAKRMVLKGQDASPLSFKEFAVANKSLSALSELVNRAQSMTNLSLANVLRALGFGYWATGSLSKRLDSLKSRRLRRTILALMQPGAPMGVVHWEAWFALDRITGFSVVPDAVQPRFVQSFRDYYKEKIGKVLADFESVRARLALLDQGGGQISAEIFGQYGTDPKDLVRPIYVELPILRSAMERVDELGEQMLDYDHSTLSDAYVHYRGMLEELEALRLVKNLFERPKSKDPKFMYNELKLWERMRRLVDKARKGGVAEASRQG